ncbi:MAG: HEAT repeat domain-containing protein [Polyangiaceae bacterium]
MSRLPRTDILDEGEFVLRSLPREAAPSLRRLLDFEQRSLAPSVKTSILRAVARLDWVNSVQTARAALNDLDPEVRDAAASLFAELGDAGSRVALEKRLERESNDFVRQSIREAIDSLQS